jgi:hypothetical protein
VPWTQPEEYLVVIEKPLPALAGLYPEGVRAMPCGGPPDFLPRETFEAEVRRRFTWFAEKREFERTGRHPPN